MHHNVLQIYFRGHRILDAILNALFKRGLKEATQVLLTGCSAGGLATYLHAGRHGYALTVQAL